MKCWLKWLLASFFFQWLLTAVSLLPAVWVFVVSNNDNITPNFMFTPKYPAFSHIISLAIIVIATLLVYQLTKYGDKEDMCSDSITSVRPANDNFLPAYLGYFFVAIKIDEWSLFFWVFLLIFILVWKSRIFCVNPVLSVFGYRFYWVEENNVESLIITRKHIKSASSMKFTDLRRINDYTFIDMEKT